MLDDTLGILAEEATGVLGGLPPGMITIGRAVLDSGTQTNASKPVTRTETKPELALTTDLGDREEALFRSLTARLSNSIVRSDNVHLTREQRSRITSGAVKSIIEIYDSPERKAATRTILRGTDHERMELLFQIARDRRALEE